MFERYSSWIVLVVAALVLFVKSTHSTGGTRYVSHKNCNNLPKGRIVPNPANCSQYIMCNGLRSTLGECPHGSFYNSDMLSCDKNNSQCPVKEMVMKPTVPASNIIKVPVKMTTLPPKLLQTTTEQPSTVPPLPMYVDGRPLCSMWEDIQFPHPTNCAYYYKCLKGFLTIHRCYFGYLWDWLMRRCLPETLAQCHSRDAKQ